MPIGGRGRSRRSVTVTLSVLIPAALILSACQGVRTASSPRAGDAHPYAASTTSTEPGSACTIPGRFAGQDLERLALVKKKVALTFDGGSGAQGVNPILRTLADRHVPATFFLTGAFVRTFPRKAARIGALHLVGNHTDTHADLTRLTTPQIRHQVQTAQAAIIAATGQDPRRFFRFPFGARDARTIAAVNALCYVPFRWTVDSLGWKGTSGGRSVQSTIARVLGAASPGAIVLMHLGANPEDHSTLDADALPTIIDRLRSRGFTFVRLSAVMSPAP